jgi:hypothetical protein
VGSDGGGGKLGRVETEKTEYFFLYTEPVFSLGGGSRRNTC